VEGTVASEASATGARTGCRDGLAPEVPVSTVRVRAAEPEETLAFLAGLERSTGVPPVDEDEQRRLAGEPPIRDRDWSWGGHLAVIDDVPVAYAGTRLPPLGAAARVDLALDRAHTSASLALRAALEDARDHAARRGAVPVGDVQAWLRGATEADLAAATDVGFTLVRRLHVMGLTLPTGRSSTPASETSAVLPDGLHVRPFDPDRPSDADAVVALFSAAYPGSEGGWDAAGFAVRRATTWFRPEDLLLLEEAAPGGPARLLGVHWTKRRTRELGEVHNLALHPDAQGRGLGGPLLDAGVGHLQRVGSREVILWVDATNAPALALYRSRGFTVRWDDIALCG
jgi:mycothiol synthase